MTTLLGLFIEEAHELLHVERYIANLVPQFSDKVTSLEVSTTLREEENQTQEQIARLENLFRQLNVLPEPVSCPPLDCLIREGKLKLCQMETPALRDVFIIASLHKIKHFEIAAYEMAHRHALQLGMHDTAGVLLENLTEERKTVSHLLDLIQIHVDLQPPIHPEANSRLN